LATVLTPLLLIGAAIAAMVAYKRLRAEVTQQVARLEMQVAPLILEARGTLQQVQHISESLRRRVDDVDRGVTSLQNKTTQLSDSVKGVMGGTLGRVLSAFGAVMDSRASRRAS
jgi:hypothetical protein